MASIIGLKNLACLEGVSETQPKERVTERHYVKRC